MRGLCGRLVKEIPTWINICVFGPRINVLFYSNGHGSVEPCIEGFTGMVLRMKT